ncbi:MAG: hypothetical protein LBM07_04455 [Culturomica sp.]|nr:hypothetical protein [Culturomica sp.]
MSGNTFGAKHYSDGKMIAPMLPQFPDLTKCKKCDHIFWLSDLRPVAKKELGDDFDGIDWGDGELEQAEFLEIDDLFRALKKVRSTKKIFNVRLQIWWGYNDRVRYGHKLFFKDQEDANLWAQNCRALLLELGLQPTSDDNLAIIAELHRNLGETELALETIKRIKDDELSKFKEQFIRECSKKNRRVFKIGEQKDDYDDWDDEPDTDAKYEAYV